MAQLSLGFCAEISTGTLQGIHPRAWHWEFRMEKNSLWISLSCRRALYCLSRCCRPKCCSLQAQGTCESSPVHPPTAFCSCPHGGIMRRCFTPSASTGRLCRAPMLCPTVPGTEDTPQSSQSPRLLWCGSAGSCAGCSQVETPSASPLQTDILETHLHLPLGSQGDLEMGSCS